MRKPELDLQTRVVFSDRADIRLKQPVIEVTPPLGSHAGRKLGSESNYGEIGVRKLGW